jgi:uncharacterized protein with HEPN domain
MPSCELWRSSPKPGGAYRRILETWHSTINWKAVAAARNIYRHEYESIDPKVVWRTVTVDLQDLEAIVRQELRRIDNLPSGREHRP